MLHAKASQASSFGILASKLVASLYNKSIDYMLYENNLNYILPNCKLA